MQVRLLHIPIIIILYSSNKVLHSSMVEQRFVKSLVVGSNPAVKDRQMIELLNEGVREDLYMQE